MRTVSLTLAFALMFGATAWGGGEVKDPQVPDFNGSKEDGGEIEVNNQSADTIVTFIDATPAEINAILDADNLQELQDALDAVGARNVNAGADTTFEVDEGNHSVYAAIIGEAGLNEESLRTVDVEINDDQRRVVVVFDIEDGLEVDEAAATSVTRQRAITLLAASGLAALAGMGLVLSRRRNPVR